jgi:hypothetical protein
MQSALNEFVGSRTSDLYQNGMKLVSHWQKCVNSINKVYSKLTCTLLKFKVENRNVFRNNLISAAYKLFSLIL